MPDRYLTGRHHARIAEYSGRRYSTDELFFGQTTITIQHNGEPYTLRITRNGKLILTK